jgi:hypothetical protein
MTNKALDRCLHRPRDQHGANTSRSKKERRLGSRVNLAQPSHMLEPGLLSRPSEKMGLPMTSEGESVPLSSPVSGAVIAKMAEFWVFRLVDGEIFSAVQTSWRSSQSDANCSLA